MTTTVTSPQNQKLIDFLSGGNTVTSDVARRKLGIRNLRARVNELREAGVCVFTTRTTKGTAYKLGQPTPTIVAAAYNAVGSSVFTTLSN